MPTYRVLRPIEHNNQIYFPADAEAVPKKRPSGGNGRDVSIDLSGVIELTEEEALALDAMNHGQVPVFQGKPDSIEAAKKREAAKQKSEKGK